MFVCPHCRSHLDRVQADIGLMWVCGECHGKGMTLPILEKVCHRDHRNLIWWTSRNKQAPRVRPCFHCDQVMVEVADIPAKSGRDLTLDMCDRCQVIWFDPGEFEDLPESAPEEKNRELPQQARELMALHEVERIQREAEESETGIGVSGPNEIWKWIPGLLGMPVQYGAPAKKDLPWVTWGLGAVVAMIGLIALANLSEAARGFGYIPSEALRYGGMTVFTSFFIHGGLAHLAVNLYFFLTFGDNVEDFLGRRRYLILIGAATLGGAILHTLPDPRSIVPVIGASGGISGILAFYALTFPRSRVGLTHWWYWVLSGGRWLCLPVWMIFAGWLILQLLGVWLQLGGWSNVSALAHLGGAAAGFLLWLVWRNDTLYKTDRTE